MKTFNWDATANLQKVKMHKSALDSSLKFYLNRKKHDEANEIKMEIDSLCAFYNLKNGK